MMQDNKVRELTMTQNIIILLALTPFLQCIGAYELKRSANPAS
jgi:hypothetical protein